MDVSLSVCHLVERRLKCVKGLKLILTPALRQEISEFILPVHKGLFSAAEVRFAEVVFRLGYAHHPPR